MRRTAESIRPKTVRLSSGELTLADWLDFSWFYPEGFEGEEILETTHSWTVLGNGIAYKFIKSNDPPGGPAAERWRKSCHELLDNTPLGSGAYLGLRCLHREEEELVWESRARSAEVNPNAIPPSVEDVALVLKRLQPEERLDNLLLLRSVSTASFLTRVAAELSRFHSATRSRAEVLPAADQFVHLTEIRHLTPLRDLLLRSGLTADRRLSRTFEELLCYLSRFLERSAPQFRERLRSGAILDCHRNIRCRNIYLLREEIEKIPQPVIIGRQDRESGQRIDDCLYDVASLAVDLQSREFLRHAELFEESYFAHAPQSHSAELYAFFKAAACIERLCATLAGAEIEDESDLMEKTDQLVSLAVRLVYGLNRPALLILQGMKEDNVAQNLADVLGADFRSDEETLPDYIAPKFPADFLAERMLEQCRMSLEAGKIVVLAVRNFSWMTPERLQTYLRAVPCFHSVFGPLGSSQSFTGDPACLELPFLSDSFNLIDQVFLTLRELSIRARNE